MCDKLLQDRHIYVTTAVDCDSCRRTEIRSKKKPSVFSLNKYNCMTPGATVVEVRDILKRCCVLCLTVYMQVLCLRLSGAFTRAICTRHTLFILGYIQCIIGQHVLSPCRNFCSIVYTSFVVDKRFQNCAQRLLLTTRPMYIFSYILVAKIVS